MAKKKNSIKKQDKEQRVGLMQKSLAKFYDQKTAVVKHDVTYMRQIIQKFTTRKKVKTLAVSTITLDITICAWIM